MNSWIDINEMLPKDSEMKKYHVKMQVGSIDTKVVETVVLGRARQNQFRFMVGDWQRVTHWKEYLGA